MATAKEDAKKILNDIKLFCEKHGIKYFNMFLMMNDLDFYGCDSDIYDKDKLVFEVFEEGFSSEETQD